MSEYLLISDAAKEVKVESHVLRYWEEELKLPIKRNELGHRYYTAEDVERFRQIKDLKERGFQLKAIKGILRDGKLEFINRQGWIWDRSAEQKREAEDGNGTEKGNGTQESNGAEKGRLYEDGRETEGKREIQEVKNTEEERQVDESKGAEVERKNEEIRGGEEENGVDETSGLGEKKWIEATEILGEEREEVRKRVLEKQRAMLLGTEHGEMGERAENIHTGMAIEILESRELTEAERKDREMTWKEECSDIAWKEKEYEEVARKEGEREDIARKEKGREETARKEGEREDIARKEKEREETARKEKERKEVARREEGVKGMAWKAEASEDREIVQKEMPHGEKEELSGSQTSDEKLVANREEKARRIQFLLRQIIQETVKESSEEFCRLVKESVIKELDYQFRLQEERQEERDRLQVKRSEEYYRRMDALLREKSGRDAKKAFPFGNAFLSKMKETR